MNIDKLLDISENFEKVAKKSDSKKEKPRDDFIFPSTHPKVKEGDHFPINTEGRARNALARANQYSKAPPWYKGSLSDLVSTVAKAVKRKYKGIEVSEASKKPGKGAETVYDLIILANWLGEYDFNHDPECVYDGNDFRSLGYK